MNLDETTASYGLFQALFAWLSDRVATALFYCGRDRSAETYTTLLARPFGKNLAMLEAELSKRPDDYDAYSMLMECQHVRALSHWRNERIHARVEIDSSTLEIALYSWRTRQRLPMDPDEIKEKILRVIMATTLLEVFIRERQHEHQMERTLEEVLGPIDFSAID